MNRARFTFAATLVGASCLAAAAFAQTPAPAPAPAPAPMTSILAGKKFTPPFKGQAEIEFTKPVTKRDKEMVVTTIQVRNTQNAPLLRLTIDETWYDKAGGLVTGGKGVIARLEPGEVGTVKIETPFNAKMSANNYNFAHANGTVKPRRVEKLVAACPRKRHRQATPRGEARRRHRRERTGGEAGVGDEEEIGRSRIKHQECVQGGPSEVRPFVVLGA